MRRRPEEAHFGISGSAGEGLRADRECAMLCVAQYSKGVSHKSKSARKRGVLSFSVQ
jgi:hypothetical protein